MRKLVLFFVLLCSVSLFGLTGCNSNQNASQPAPAETSVQTTTGTVPSPGQ